MFELKKGSLNILITSARAPVAIEWAMVAQKCGHRVTFVDTLRNPLGRWIDGVTYKRIASPRFDFSQYRVDMDKLLGEHDLVIPTCEDVFYLAEAFEHSQHAQKIFAPSFDLLIGLHNKETVKKYLNEYVRFPKTVVVENRDAVDLTLTKSILKPVYSRFGTNVERSITKETLDRIKISPERPWIQQELIVGHYICNYAIIENGTVISHVVYQPKYLVNDAASTYFEQIENPACNRFIEQFAKDTNYTGQVAFDLIENADGLYIIECNPRATSGLHIVAKNVEIRDGHFSAGETAGKCYRAGSSILFMFGLKYLFAGKIRTLWSDYKSAHDVLGGIPFMAQILAFSELLLLKWRHGISFAEATAYDIEYNNERAK